MVFNRFTLASEVFQVVLKPVIAFWPIVLFSSLIRKQVLKQNPILLVREFDTNLVPCNCSDFG
ncbi:MAG: hypothetical protein EBT92_17125 [Planctomycetes bacterium]|nr:hypothetical protein [Planctomycetota bacterium]